MSQPLNDNPVAAGAGGNRALARFRQAAEIVAGVMFALVFLIFNYKIVTRYIGHHEAIWADEISVILFIWIVFWTSSFLVSDKEQIRFDLAYHGRSDRTKRAMSIARLLLIGGIFIWALPGSLDYIMFLWRERTAVLELKLDYIYSCFGLFMVAVIVRSGFMIVKLLGPTWRRYI